jgi:RHH-type proline utilization regulon transcriptional repressor/proline dehydrogenase/delta 1-pyrroline-5-carboxylate dehydrogenase
LPCDALLIRASEDAVLADVLLACLAARTAETKVTLSLHPAFAARVPWLSGVPGVASVVEDASQLAARAATYERIRNVGAVEPALRVAADEAGVHVARDPVLRAGRIELLNYLREQSLSVLTHRYGSLHAEALSPFQSERLG